MISSLCNRMVHVPVYSRMPALDMTVEDVSPDYDSWKDWAYRAGVAPEVVAYLGRQPQNLWRATGQVAYATYRSWHFCSDIFLAFGGIAGIKESAPFLAGAVGEGPATEFAGFVRCWEDVPDVDALLAGKPVPAPKTVDGRYAFCAALVARMIQLKKRRKDLTKEAERVLSYLPNLPEEFQVLLLCDLYRSAGLGTLFSGLPGFLQWQASHREVFAA